MRTRAAPARVGATVGIYLVLTLLVWGLFAPDRGLFQDDAYTLAETFSRISRSPLDLFGSLTTPTRRLQTIPFALAWWSGHPVVFLQLLYGLVWLGLGLAAYRLALQLSRDPTTAFLAGALTICATSDGLTDSLVSLAYNLATLLFFVALVLFLRWLRTGGIAALAGATVTLHSSLWTVDAALTSLLLVPLLLWWLLPTRQDRRRVWLGAAVWIGLLVPYLAVFAWSLTDRTGYAASALHAFPPGQHLARAWALFAHNFTAWRWAAGFPAMFGRRPDAILPAFLAPAAAILGGALFAWGLHRYLRDPRAPGDSRDRSTRRWTLAGLLLVFALAANFGVAALDLSQLLYRTHVLSRVWASLFLAVFSRELLARGRTWRPIGWAIPVAFVTLGVAGGVERQDYFLASWREHRAQLRSLVRAVPSLAPQAELVIDSPPSSRYLPTEAHYLACTWAVLLYQDPTLWNRVFLSSPERRLVCTPAASGLECARLWEEDCFRDGSCPGSHIPYERLVVARFRDQSGEFELARDLPAALRPGTEDQAAATGYDPLRLIQPDALDRPSLRSRLLAGPRGLARLLVSSGATSSR